jgi:hypothetical protein
VIQKLNIVLRSPEYCLAATFEYNSSNVSFRVSVVWNLHTNIPVRNTTSSTVTTGTPFVSTSLSYSTSGNTSYPFYVVSFHLEPPFTYPSTNPWPTQPYTLETIYTTVSSIETILTTGTTLSTIFTTLTESTVTTLFESGVSVTTVYETAAVTTVTETESPVYPFGTGSPVYSILPPSPAAVSTTTPPVNVPRIRRDMKQWEREIGT